MFKVQCIFKKKIEILENRATYNDVTRGQYGGHQHIFWNFMGIFYVIIMENE